MFRGQHVCLYLCIADGGGGEGGSEPGDSLRFLTVWPSLEGGEGETLGDSWKCPHLYITYTPPPIRYSPPGIYLEDCCRQA